jgi:hypothetical protein
MGDKRNNGNGCGDIHGMNITIHFFK